MPAVTVGLKDGVEDREVDDDHDSVGVTLIVGDADASSDADDDTAGVPDFETLDVRDMLPDREDV